MSDLAGRLVVLWMGLWMLALPGLPGAAAAEPGAPSTKIKPETLRAFNVYLSSAEARNEKSRTGNDFLWVDGLSDKEKSEAYEKLKAGEVLMRQVKGSEGDSSPDIPGGMIHDWEGIAFLPGAKLDEVLRVLKDYNKQSLYYAPDVEKSKIESVSGDHYVVFLRFRRKKVVTVVLDTEHDIRYYRDSPTRAHSRSSAIRITEVEDPGTPKEKELQPGDDGGYMLKLETWWRLEEKNGGVYVQNEAVSLTRDVPAGLGWLIKPFIISIPKESIEFTLKATRTAVQQQNKSARQDQAGFAGAAGGAVSRRWTSSAWRSQENDWAAMAADSPSRAARAESDKRCWSVAASAAESQSGGRSNASRPLVRDSLIPAAGETTMGSPQAIASSAGRLKESSSDGAT